MHDWKSLVGLVLVFTLGVLGGLLLAMGIGHHRVTVLLRPGSLAYEQMVERRLSRGLQLDEVQRTKLHDVLFANIEARKKLQLQIQPQLQTLNVQTRHKIRDILTAEQMAVFRHNMGEFRRRFGGPGNGVRPLEQEGDDASNSPFTGATNMAPVTN